MFSGFLNRERKNNREQPSGDSTQVFSSNAAAALAASVAAAPGVETLPGAPQPQGRSLQGSVVDVDLDKLLPGEAVPELQVCVAYPAVPYCHETFCTKLIAQRVCRTMSM